MLHRRVKPVKSPCVDKPGLKPKVKILLKPSKQERCPMPWQTIPGVIGKVFVPESAVKAKKHPCNDCFACQNCSQERCRVCRQEKRGVSCTCLSDKEVST